MDLREVKASAMYVWRCSESSALLAEYVYAARTDEPREPPEVAPHEHRLHLYLESVGRVSRAAQARAARCAEAVAAASFVVHFAQQLTQFALALAAAMQPLTADSMMCALDNVVVDHDGLIQKQQSILKIVLRGHVTLRPEFVSYHCVTFYEAKVYLWRRVSLKFFNQRVVATFRDPALFWRAAHAASGRPGSLFHYVALYGPFEAYRYFFYQLHKTERGAELWLAVDALLHSGRMTANKLFFSLFHLTPGSRAQFIRKYFVSIFKMCFDDMLFRPLSFTYYNFEKNNITQRQAHEVMLHLLSKNEWRHLSGTNICLYKQREFIISLREMQLFFLRFWDDMPLEHKLNTKRILGILNLINNFIVCRQFRIVAVIFKDECVENYERQIILSQYFKKGPGSNRARLRPPPQFIAIRNKQ